MPDQNWLVVNGLVCPVSFNSKKRKIIGCPSGLSTGDRQAVTIFSPASEEIGQQLGSFYKYKISNMGVDNNYYSLKWRWRVMDI